MLEPHQYSTRLGRIIRSRYKYSFFCSQLIRLRMTVLGIRERIIRLLGSNSDNGIFEVLTLKGSASLSL